jgi:hypothetical protein
MVPLLGHMLDAKRRASASRFPAAPRPCAARRRQAPRAQPSKLRLGAARFGRDTRMIFEMLALQSAGRRGAAGYQRTTGSLIRVGASSPGRALVEAVCGRPVAFGLTPKTAHRTLYSNTASANTLCSVRVNDFTMFSWSRPYYLPALWRAAFCRSFHYGNCRAHCLSIAFTHP